MAFVQASFGGMSGGVSEQPDILRYPGQCSKQTNMIVDVVNGLRRRGELELVRLLDSSPADEEAAYHWFSLEDMDYVARISHAGIDVFDMDGNHFPVPAPINYAYLQSCIDTTCVSTVQVGEYNLIASSAIKPAMGTVVEEETEYVTFHYGDGMTWGMQYYIKVGNTILATYLCPDGSDVNPTTTKSTESLWIAQEMYLQITNTSTGVQTKGWAAVLIDNTIMMRRLHADYEPSYRASQFSITDSVGGANVSCTINSVQTLDKLPPRSYPGHWVHISGKESSSIDDFYMEYETTDGTLTAEGVWKETAKPTEAQEIDPLTMPHALVRVEDGTWVFTPLDGSTIGGSVIDKWAKRCAGDADSNPAPAFLGQAIKHMTMVQQRLAFITDDNVNMSVAQGEFDWFSKSALSSTDTDPIELTTPGERAAHLFAAVEHEQNLLVLGDKRQFAIPLVKALTSSIAALVPTTSYDVDTRCLPTAVGGGMFFAFSDRIRTGIREYRAHETISTHMAEEVTSNLGTYLPAHLRGLYADRQGSTLLALSLDGGELFMYQFLYHNGERILNAWSKHTFPKVKIHSISSIDGYFYMIGVKEDGSILLFKLQKPGTLFLDYQYTAVVDTSGGVDISTWPFRNAIAVDDIIAVVGSGTYAGLRVEVDELHPSWVQLRDRDTFNGESVIIGVRYCSEYAPTMPVIRDEKGNAKQLDRLVVNQVEVSVADSGSYDIQTEAKYYDTIVQEFNGRYLGSTFVVGATAPSTRQDRLSLGHNAREAVITFMVGEETDLIIQALEYKGAYTQRGQRI